MTDMNQRQPLNYILIYFSTFIYDICKTFKSLLLCHISNIRKCIFCLNFICETHFFSKTKYVNKDLINYETDILSFLFMQYLLS